jgi:hypothetical protein
MTEPVEDSVAEPVEAVEAEGPSEAVEAEGPSEAVRAVRERFPEPPREGSLKKLAPGQGLALIGIVFCAWTPYIFWYVFGPIAFVLGYLAYRKGERRARWLMLAAVVCMIAGFVITQLPDKFVSN